jgi:hypothetical protein
MKTIKILLFIPFLFITSCEKADKNVPECINDLIKNHSKEMFLCETGASAKQYLFQGDYVYVFEPGNCGADMMAPVYNSSCNCIGGLGGIAGNIIINGVRFDQKAKYIKTIWTN